VEVVSVMQHRKDAGTLEQIGGIAYLSSLQDAVPSAANLSYYLDVMTEKATARKMIRLCETAMAKAYTAAEIGPVVDEFEKDALQIRRVASGNNSLKETCRLAVERMQTMFESGGKISGLSTGLHDLDRLTDGMHGGEMIVVAAYPSCGKSALAAQIAVHNAVNHIPAAIFSCEMRPVNLVMRAICAASKINLYDIRDGMANMDDFDRMSRQVSKLSSLPLFIENTNGFSIGQLVALARRMKQQHGIKFAVVDYIQLLSCEAGSREQEISGISKGLKAIAMELDIPVMALSQLNDEGKLRESRAIGQDADSVWKLSNDGEWQPRIQPVKLCAEKNREGATGQINLTFFKEHTRFELAAKVSEEDVPKQYKG
jgi:replicative DNA helicase